MSAPRALVLAAGLGTRLRPLTYVRAKAAVPVNGEPLVRRIAAWLGGRGIRDLIVNLHHQPESVAACLGDGSDLGIRVRYSWENPVLGSAGGPRHALPLLVDGGATRYLVVNGDTLTDVDLDAILAAHDRSGALVTMALIRNPAPEKYGGVLVSPDGWVSGFTRRGTAATTFHFIGVQLVEAEVFAGLPDGQPCESIAAVYPALMRSNPQSVAAFVSDATFRDIGTPADCLGTSLDLAASEGSRLIGRAARIDPTAVIERCVLWDDVTVGARARLADCVVGDGVVIPAGAAFERCAIVPARDRAASDGERIEDFLLVRDL
jgi:mannose-1-phosphate guanylyltransferase